jgi:predicted AAA+ superfamily ATPase
MDTGVRNFIAGNLSLLNQRPDKGPLYENIFFSELTKATKAPQEIRFWRTQTGAEVDFIMTHTNKYIPIEIKSVRIKKSNIPKSLKNFIIAHEPKTAVFATTDFCDKIQYRNTKIYFIPLCWLLLNNSIASLFA